MKRIIVLLSVVASLSVDAQILVPDTRDTNPPPTSFNNEVRFDFKRNSTINLPVTQNHFSGLMTFAPWGDNSGNKSHQLDFSDDGLFWRSALPEAPTWEPWRKVIIEKSSGNVEVTGNTPTVLFKVRHPNENEAFGLVMKQYSDLSGYIACDGRDFNVTAGWDKKLVLGSPEFSQWGGRVIFPGGNVGIGTENTSGAKLTVAGDIHSREVRVTVNAGADYVFEDDYKLPSLAEVEAYVKANKHLPEVPSEKEMQANGLNLMEMNILLLKKVEELTLHLIEMEKENLIQKSRLDKQQLQIFQLLNR